MTLDVNTGEVLDDFRWPKEDFWQYEQQSLRAKDIETVFYYQDGGVKSPVLFCNAGRDVQVSVHGDDIIQLWVKKPRCCC